MEGIYKITNKLNGKSYIGQSIHCGKRLDEHCKGNQLIDEIIQIEGIENFSFEILKQCSKNEMSIWEDYYIIKYNTMFPSGYNKRWNCSEDLRKILKINKQEEAPIEEKKEKIKIKEVKTIKENKIENKYLRRVPATRKGENGFIKLTSNQWGLYYWLMMHSFNDNNEEKQRYFLYMDSISYDEIKKDLDIKSNRTIIALINKLKELQQIDIVNNIIYIPYPKTYTYLSINLMKYLLKQKYSTNKVITLYSNLKKIKELNDSRNDKTTFTIKSVCRDLGYGGTDYQAHNTIKELILLLSDDNLIKIEQKIKRINGGECVEYTLLEIKEEKDNNLLFL